MTKMIPPVPTSAVMLPTPKQKIGFSIDSIVGNDAATNHNITTNTTTQTTIVKNEQHSEQTNLNGKTTQNGPSSPPQTPPSNASAAAASAAHLPSSPAQQHFSPLPPHLSLLAPNAHTHPAHMPPHLTMAQQHALHQHLIMQQQQRMESLAPPMRQDAIQDILQRLHNNAAAAAQLNGSIPNGPFSPPNAQTRLTPDETLPHLKRERSPIPVGLDHAQNPPQRHQPPHTPPKSVSPQSSQPSSPPALLLPGSPQATSGLPPSIAHPPPQHQYQKSLSGPTIPGMPPAGLVRPFPVGPNGPPPPGPPQQGMPDIKALPPYINAPPELPPQHNPHLIAAAQFQMAAALQAGHVLGPAAAAAAAAGLPPHAGFMAGPPGMPRDSYPLYPWLLSRHGRIFPHRFPGNFLLQPFRKPKRIRTAFSPSQLLKLEHAFESNQYVVGAERKALAQSLNLSETQVKVWFQNRRTKHKRMQQEDEKGGGGGSSDRNSQNASCDEEDDELIDMEMDDECPSDEEHDLDASH